MQNSLGFAIFARVAKHEFARVLGAWCLLRTKHQPQLGFACFASTCSARIRTRACEFLCGAMLRTVQSNAKRNLQPVLACVRSKHHATLACVRSKHQPLRANSCGASAKQFPIAEFATFGNPLIAFYANSAIGNCVKSNRKALPCFARVLPWHQARNSLPPLAVAKHTCLRLCEARHAWCLLCTRCFAQCEFIPQARVLGAWCEASTKHQPQPNSELFSKLSRGI